MLSMSARQTTMLVFLFVLTSVALILLDHQQRLDWAKSPASAIFQPVTWTFDRIGNGVGSSGSGGNPTDLSAELEAVRAERDALLAENARLKLLEEEVEQLRDQLEFKQLHPDLDPVPANVVSQDPKGIERIVVIDQGGESGIRPGMAVVSPDFFVGQVTNVDPDRARVTLVLDASFQTGGMLESSRAEGIVYGRWQAGGLIEMRHLDAGIEVDEGELVVTSGRTARVPAGLVIGKVTGIDRDLQADTLTVRITPMIDFRSLHSVTVIVTHDPLEE
jgi:rod shape-determining protein MreC